MSAGGARSFGFALASLALVALAWGFVAGLPLTGADAWAILAHGRALLAEPLETLAGPYLGEDWPVARFWRPGVSLLGAASYALFGESATGVHLLRLFLLALCGWLAAMFGARLAGPSASSRALAGLAALVVVTLHPLNAESVPVFARVGEGLVAAATLAALFLLVDARESRARGLRLGAGVLLALLPGLFKETGLVASLVALVALEPWRRGPGRAAATWASAALLAGLAAQIGARLALLGTLGRYDAGLDTPGPLGVALSVAGALLGQQHAPLASAAALLLGGLALLLGVLAAGDGGARRRPASEEQAAMRRRTLGASLLWAGALLASLLVAPRFVPRYAEGLLVPLALLLALALGRLWAEGLRGRVAGALLLAALALATLPGAPPLARYPHWALAGELASGVVDASSAALSEVRSLGMPAEERFGPFRVLATPAPQGRVELLVDPFPQRIARHPVPGAAPIESAAVLDPFALEAAAKLRDLGPLRARAGRLARDIEAKDLRGSGMAGER